MKNDPEKQEKQTKKSSWLKNINEWMEDYIFDPVLNVLIESTGWIIEHGITIIIIILCLAIPAGCIFGINKSVNKSKQEIIERDEKLGAEYLDSTEPSLKFYPVKIKGHDYWKYYHDGIHYIHSPDCKMCCKEINKDTILVISGQ